MVKGSNAELVKLVNVTGSEQLIIKDTMLVLKDVNFPIKILV